VTYIIALQHGMGLHDLDPPPVLPSNARFVNHPNHCFDIGTVAWVLDNHVPDPRCATGLMCRLCTAIGLERLDVHVRAAP
jgi:hypothetical protein